MKRQILILSALILALGAGTAPLQTAWAHNVHGGGGHGGFHGGGVRGGTVFFRGGGFRGSGFHGDHDRFRHRGFFTGALGAGIVIYPWGYTYPPDYEVEDDDMLPQGTAVYYYCPGANAYYPNVPNCPTGWEAIVASPPPDLQ